MRGLGLSDAADSFLLQPGKTGLRTYAILDTHGTRKGGRFSTAQMRK